MRQPKAPTVLVGSTHRTATITRQTLYSEVCVDSGPIPPVEWLTTRIWLEILPLKAHVFSTR